jgi:hypothetical protein
MDRADISDHHIEQLRPNNAAPANTFNEYVQRMRNGVGRIVGEWRPRIVKLVIRSRAHARCGSVVVMVLRLMSEEWVWMGLYVMDWHGKAGRRPCQVKYLVGSEAILPVARGRCHRRRPSRRCMRHSPPLLTAARAASGGSCRTWASRSHGLVTCQRSLS